MGVSTNGILVFGIDFSEEFLPFEDESLGEDFETLLANDAGIEVPEGEYSEERGKEYSRYWERCSENAKKSEIELITHCSGDYPMYILAVRGTEYNAWRGDPTEIDLDKLTVTDEQIGALKSFCELHGLVYSQPRWLLCSYWG